MAKAKESRVIRTRNIGAGTISFLDKPSGKTVTCTMAELFPDIPDDKFESFWAKYPAIVRHLILHGVNGKVGDTVASKDKDGFATMADSWDALVAGTWSQGGGGSPLDTYTVVLRQAVSDALVAIGFKRVDATKAAAKDCGEAFMHVCASVAKQIGGDTTAQAVFDIQYRKVEAAAKAEAARRDKAAPSQDVDVDSLKAALLAAATSQDEKPKAEKTAKAA